MQATEVTGADLAFLTGIFALIGEQLHAAPEVDIPMLTVALEGLRSLEGAGPTADTRLT
ncbi:hypothetical protein [Kribbella sp. C-35]|uniref:hypothetical protein n=1 Tax=Kribbella sp. C-35 TaxID=2789276 RepID=UPI00397C4C41